MQDADQLVAELDRWQAGGRTVDAWWRDDDASRPSAALSRLVRTARRHGAPLGVAVVSAEMDEPGLGDALNDRLVTVLQHGFSHENFAAPGGRAVECGGDRPLAEILDSLAAGRQRLERVFGPRFAPVMVPPWNRIEPPVAEALPGLGYEALSVFGLEGETAQGLDTSIRHLNAHLDLLTWKGGARFAGREKSIRVATKRLASIRQAGTGEPFGILTHHLDHDDETWAFLDEVLALLAGHPAVRWRSPAELSAGPASGGPAS